MSRTRTLLPVVSGVVLALALASCTPTGHAPAPSPSATPVRAGDDVLRIGTLFPASGSLSYLGGAQAAGVAIAVKEINDAGGVLGTPVELLARDSGDVSTATIEASLADLVKKHVDVLIGPSSSVLAERVLPKVVAAKIPMISPAATSARLSSTAASGYFFRTAPSAALEGPALAAGIGGGTAKLALIYFDDDDGRAIRDSLVSSGGTVVASQRFDADTTDLAAIITAVKKAAPDDVVFASPFSATEQNTAIITKLGAAGLGGAKLWLTGENTADYSQALPAGTLTGVNGILAGAEPDAAFTARVKADDPAVVSTRFAAEAYDATILAGLAATVAHDTAGTAIDARLRDVSRGGIKCTNFSECVGVLKTSSNIDYDGESGPISFDQGGDPSSAHFGLYRYDAENRFAKVGYLLGGIRALATG